MVKDRLIQIVATTCPADCEVKFNKWYNEVHIPMLLKYKGLKASARYKVAGGAKDQPKYLAFYEFDSPEAMAGMGASPEFKAAIEEMQTSWKDTPLEIKWMLNCEPIQSWDK